MRPGTWWAGALAASILSGQAPTPQFRTQVDVVTVDVHVVDGNGTPIPTLTPGDFAVTVDGKPRRVVTADFRSYENLRAPDTPSPGAPLSANSLPASSPGPGRLILIVADEANIRAGAARLAVDAAMTLVDRALPTDRIGVLSIPHSSVRLQPTADRKAVKEALARISGHLTDNESLLSEYSVGLSEAFMMQYDSRGFGEVLARECPTRARDTVDAEQPKESRPETGCKAEVERIARAMVADARQRMLTSTRSIAALLDGLSGFDGPKVVVLLSEELPVSEFVAERKDFEAEARGISRAAARAQATVYVLHLHRPLFDVETRMDPATSGRDADTRALGLETVTTLTGGRRLLISGRAEPAYDRIVREMSGYYVLGFVAEPEDSDGKTHAVAVKVQRPGADVRARREFVLKLARRPERVETSAPTTPAAIVLAPAVPAVSPAPTPVPEPAQPAERRAADKAPNAEVDRTAPLARTVEELVKRASGYVVSYGEQMGLVIGQERYGQWMSSSDLVRPVVRQLVSEFALVRVQDDWLGFRDVYDVDGKPVSDRQDRLKQVLFGQSRERLDQGRRIADESARHNLGGIQRNFNVPTTALLFLHPKNVARFKFRKDGEEALDGVAVWRVRYQETRKPTLIRTNGGRDMPLRGTFWLDPVDGRVLKSHMELTAPNTIGGEQREADDAWREVERERKQPTNRDVPAIRRIESTASITVTYRYDTVMSLMLPLEMRETYEGAWARRTTNDEELTKINCVATYSDFKRFETSGRLVVPK